MTPREPDLHAIGELSPEADPPSPDWDVLVPQAERRLRDRLAWRLRSSAAARATVRSASDEDDLVQEVLLEAAVRFDSFRYVGPGSFHRFLAEILGFKLLEEARRSRARPRLESSLRGPFEHARGSAPSGVQAALRREDRDRVRRAVARLPARERETVWLRLYHGLNGRETAARLGIDESTVSVRMRRALEVCARWLDDRDA